MRVGYGLELDSFAALCWLVALELLLAGVAL